MSKLTKFIKNIGENFPEDRLTYQKGIATFHPESAEEAARFFILANERKQELYISGFGNNIVPVGDSFKETMVIKTDRLNALIKIVPGDYYIKVGAGYPLKELNNVLKKHELFLPHADLPYVGSVGGALAAGLTADYRGHNLPISRYFIMAEIIDPQGKIIKPGSACFKSVSGFDIVKIFSPSWGLLGMIISATFRVVPTSARPEYNDIKMKALDFRKFSNIYNNPENNASALYSLKIKAKFDPGQILPIRFV